MKLQSLLLLLALCILASGPSARGMVSGGSQMYCGRRLAIALAYVCQNEFLAKRSSYDEMNAPFAWPWLGAERARALAGARGKRQVASECCLKPCTVEELLAYC